MPRGPSPGRNDPCPCGSGKKYKKCHGASLSWGWDPGNSSPTQPESAPILPAHSKPLFGAACLALTVATLAVYWQTSGHAFIRLDDGQYVYENPIVKAGLTSAGFAWAFTTFAASNWHPLTWLSLMLDCQLFGLDPGADHLINVFFHLANSALVFLVCSKLTRRPWRSLVVAGIFALHPLHVESVAWIAERKDVLSTFFGLLALLAYVFYTEARTSRRYIVMASLFALSLLAKPMLVTFPFLLLLLDFWPLRRIEWPTSWPVPKPLLLEKIPLLAMTAASSVVTILAQRNEPMISLTHLSIPDRFANAIVAYVSYLGKIFGPANLAVMYPFHVPPASSVLGALLVLAVITVASVWLARRAPYFLVGWFWYLGMLVPVIGILQVGSQSMADRYTYLPLVGLSIAIVWGAADLLESRHLAWYYGAIPAGVLLLILSIAAHRQVAYWKDSQTLFERTLAVTEGNFLIENNMALIMAEQGKHSEAIDYYQKAIAIQPDLAEPHVNLAQELMTAGRPGEAVPHLNDALRLKPDLPLAHMDLVILAAAQGNTAEENRHLNELLRLSAGDPVAQGYACFALRQIGRPEEAIAHCTESLRLDPDQPFVRFNLAAALAAQGKKNEAVAELSRVLASSPSYADARALLQELQASPGP
ncbi:MAG: tetratricopeptide repeat protein [Terriglobales bacterium]